MLFQLLEDDTMNLLYLVWIVFSYLVAAHWAIISTFVLIGVIGSLFYRNPVRRTGKKAKNVDFVIVSKASKDVEGVLFRCMDYHAKKFGDYHIDVVIDEGSGLQNRLERHINGYNNVSLHVVPQEFSVEAIAKGRAIHHHILNRVKPNKWYVFIDDDNLIIDDNFLYEILYYEKRGYVASNGILHPRYGGNPITYVADFLRYADDLTLFRFLTGVIGRPLNGFHGELMTVKGSILKKIGFDRRTITEDFAFARELDKYEHKVWQSKTVTSILSPHTIKDFIRQRNRWHRGIYEDFRSGTMRMKLVAGIRDLDLLMAIIGSWAIFPLWFFMPIPRWLIWFDAIGAAYYAIVYIYGSINLIGKVENWALYPFLLPLYSVMETIVPHYKPKGEHYAVIHKDEDYTSHDIFSKDDI